MIHVLCTGPESSGTRLLTRLVGGLGIKTTHKSIPHALNWWDETAGITHIVCIVRDPFITQISATETGHPSFWSGREATFPYRITNAWQVMLDNCRTSGLPWIPLTYEGLLLRPQWTLDNIADWIGVERKPLIEQVKDPRENIR